MINKIGRPRSGSLKLEKSWVWLLTELDDTKSCYQLMKTMTKFEKETRHLLYVFIKKKLLTRRNAEQQRAHMKRSVHLHMYDVLTVPLTVLYTVQVQAWRVHCPISAQIGLVITNHVREFYYGFDQYFHCFCFITPWVPFIIPRKAFKGTCLHNDWIAKVRSSSYHRGKKGQSHWKNHYSLWYENGNSRWTNRTYAS